MLSYLNIFSVLVSFLDKLLQIHFLYQVSVSTAKGPLNYTIANHQLILESLPKHFYIFIPGTRFLLLWQGDRERPLHHGNPSINWNYSTNTLNFSELDRNLFSIRVMVTSGEDKVKVISFFDFAKSNKELNRLENI